MEAQKHQQNTNEAPYHYKSSATVKWNLQNTKKDLVATDMHFSWKFSTYKNDTKIT